MSTCLYVHTAGFFQPPPHQNHTFSHTIEKAAKQIRFNYSIPPPMIASTGVLINPAPSAPRSWGGGGCSSTTSSSSWWCSSDHHFLHCLVPVRFCIIVPTATYCSHYTVHNKECGPHDHTKQPTTKRAVHWFPQVSAGFPSHPL